MKFDKQAVQKTIDDSNKRCTRNNATKATNPYQKKGKNTNIKRKGTDSSKDSDYSDNKNGKPSVVSPSNSSNSNDKKNYTVAHIPRDIKYNTIVDKNDGNSIDKSADNITYPSLNKTKKR
jgi:hypothetical protein